VPGAVAVRAARRLASAAASGRAREELRSLQVDPLRRYVLRLPHVFRAARPAFAEDAALVADVTPAASMDEHACPQGLYWDDGPPIPPGTERLRRIVRRTVAGFERGAVERPLNWGAVEFFTVPVLSVWRVVSISRATRLPVIGEAGAALRVAGPRVKPPSGYGWMLPANGFVVPLDLVRPA
jgi:hypothetical protein